MAVAARAPGLDAAHAVGSVLDADHVLEGDVETFRKNLPAALAAYQAGDAKAFWAGAARSARPAPTASAAGPRFGATQKQRQPWLPFLFLRVRPARAAFYRLLAFDLRLGPDPPRSLARDGRSGLAGDAGDAEALAAILRCPTPVVIDAGALTALAAMAPESEPMVPYSAEAVPA